MARIHEAQGVERFFISRWVAEEERAEGEWEFLEAWLAMDMGKFKKGEQVPCVVIDYQQCRVTIEDFNGTMLFSSPFVASLEPLR